MPPDERQNGTFCVNGPSGDRIPDAPSPRVFFDHETKGPKPLFRVNAVSLPHHSLRGFVLDFEFDARHRRARIEPSAANCL